MGRVTMLKTAFNAGELSPYFEGRVDQAKYSQGLSKSQNMIPTVQGSATRRPGTVFVENLQETAESAENAAVLIPHDIAADEAWMYEIHGNRSRISAYRNRAPSLSYLFPNPLKGKPRRADGTSKISKIQKGRDLFIADDGTSPAFKITNTGTTITSEPLFGSPSAPLQVLSNANPTPFVQNYDTPPFQDYAPEEKPIIEVGITNTAYGYLYVHDTLKAPAGTFAGRIGCRLILNPDVSEMDDVEAWVQDLPVSNSSILTHQGRFYQFLIDPAIVDDFFSATEPLHEFGAIYSKTYGIRAQAGYIGNGHFSCVITSEPTAYGAGDEIVTVLWDHINAPKMKTARWAWAAVATGDVPEPGAAYPDNLSIWRSRLALSAGGKLFFSVAGKYQNFNQYTPSGAIAADRLVSVEIPSNQLVSTEWMVSQDRLIIGAKIGIFAVSPETDSEPFGPGNVRIEQVSTSGSHSVEAVTLDREIMYVARGGKRLMRLGQSSEGWRAIDLSVIADHIGAAGIVELCWQAEPWRIVWMVTADGDLVGMTWNQDQDVYGWHPHRSGFGDKVRGIASIPAPSGLIDDLWIYANRKSLGDLYYGNVEYMADAHPIGGDVRAATYVDCSFRFDGSRASEYAAANGVVISGGTLWDESEVLTVRRVGTASQPASDTFAAGDVGVILRCLASSVVGGVNVPTPGGEFIELLIESHTSPTEVLARPLRTVPMSLRGPSYCWEFRRTEFLVPYLDGRVVDVLADGCSHAQVTVTGGVATLDYPSCRVLIGIPAHSIMRPMRLELGGDTGTTQTKIKRVDHVSLRLLETIGCRIGRDESNLDEIPFRTPSNQMNEPVPAFTGDKKLNFNGGNSPDGYVVVANDQPMPFTLLSMVIDLTTE